MGLIISLAIGVLVGWNTTEPAVIKNAKQKVLALVKK